ncbi:uncharacterized protein LOC141908182 isoform X2 [Tubulanus polymorphus]|uniref:uncharacterized protein LOC141908182 isoform X2 n=1 Tax=Tubulanus polymorphus TaxID=672921 RepID=UPI003DA63AB6
MSSDQQQSTQVAPATTSTESMSSSPTTTNAPAMTSATTAPIQQQQQVQPQQQQVQSPAQQQQQQQADQQQQIQQQQIQIQQQQVQQVQAQQVQQAQVQVQQAQVQVQQAQVQQVQQAQVQAQQQLQQLGNQNSAINNTPSSLGLTLQSQQVQAQAMQPQMRSPLQQVQVIQPVHSQAYLQQFYNQQQFMLQNAAAVQAAMQVRGLSPQLNLALPGRPIDQKNTAMVLPATSMPQTQTTCTTTPWGMNPADIWTTNPTPQAALQQQQQGQTQATVSTSSTGAGTSAISTALTPTSSTGKTLQTIAGKPIAATPTATQMIAGKPVMQQRPGVPQPLVIGQIGVIPNQNATNQALMSQMGQYTNMGKGQTVTVAAAQPQLINSPIRFTGHQLVTNTGQIISSQPMLTNPAVLNQLQAMASLQQNIPIAQHVIGSQSPGILTNQSPVYIRATMPMPQQAPPFPTVSAVGALNAGAASAALSNSTPASPMRIKQNASTGEPSVVNNATAAQPVVAQQKPTTIKQNSSSQTVRNMMNMMARVAAAQNSNNAANNNSATSAVNTTTVSTAATATSIPAGAVRASGNLSRQISRVKGKSQSKPSSPVPPTAQQKIASSSPAPSAPSSTSASTAAATMVTNGASGGAKSSTTSEAESASTASTILCKAEKASDVIGSGAGEKKDAALVNGVKPLVDNSEEPPQLEKQKAIVKPHVLTHIIDGYVIQEANEPFPVQRSSLLTDVVPPKIPRIDKESEEEHMKEDKGETTDENGQHATLKCEFCGKVDLTAKFKRSKRFCSLACTKRYNVGCSKRLGLFQPKGNNAVSVPQKIKKKRSILKRRQWRRQGGRLALNMIQQKQQSLNVSPEKSLPSSSPPSQFSMPPHSLPNEETTDSSSQSCQDDTATSSPATPMQQDFEMLDSEPSKPPAKWSTEDVYEFIKSLPGCANHAQEFRAQEIDGQALLLLKEDHLMSAMNMKLGPALKICARINSLRDEVC